MAGGKLKAQGRHGDVLVHKVSSLPAGALVQVADVPGQAILAYGEVTGHAHRVKDPTAQLWLDGANTYLTVDQVAQLTHEEHHTITLEPGVYQVIHQVEYSPSAMRRVVD